MKRPTSLRRKTADEAKVGFGEVKSKREENEGRKKD
jgi:hypothetical protein